MIEPFLFLQRIIDIGGNEGFPLPIVIVNGHLFLAFAPCGGRRSRLLFLLFLVLEEFLEECHRGLRQMRLTQYLGPTANQPAELVEELEKRRTVKQNLQNRVSETHVTRIDEASRCKFAGARSIFSHGSCCEQGDEVGLFAG